MRARIEREPDNASGCWRVCRTARPQNHRNLYETGLRQCPGIKTHAIATRYTQMGRRRLGPRKWIVFINVNSHREYPRCWPSIAGFLSSFSRWKCVSFCSAYTYTLLVGKWAAKRHLRYLEITCSTRSGCNTIIGSWNVVPEKWK